MKGSSPLVHDGRQGKHIPGHNNYKLGRSILTADPSALSRKAGSGQQVGSTQVGLPGSKERVNFGEFIGEYIDSNGNSIPAMNGMIHYSKKGLHIVPARP